MALKKTDKKTRSTETKGTGSTMKKASGSKTSSSKKKTTVPAKRRGRRPKKIVEESESDRDPVEESEQEGPAIIAKLPYVPTMRKSTSMISGVARSRDILEMTQTKVKSRGMTGAKVIPISDDESDYYPPKRSSGRCNQCVKYEKLVDGLRNKVTTLEKKIAGDDKSIIYTNNLGLVDHKTGKKVRLRETKIRCRHDHHPINGIPFPFPTFSLEGETGVSHLCCSSNCAIAYNLSLNDSRVDVRNAMIYRLHRKMHQIPYSEKIIIKPADPIEVIDVYGGYKTIEKYREDFQRPDKTCRVYFPPIRPTGLVIEEKVDGDEDEGPQFSNARKKVSVVASVKSSGRR